MESKMQDLGKILAKFEQIVSPNFCNTLAKQTRFVQRSTSQLQGYEFARALMIPNAYIEAETLNSLALRMQQTNPACNLSAPALAQRINSKTGVRFMKACFGKVLKEFVSKELAALSDLPKLSMFNRVLIEDSTKAELNEKLSSHFRGGGGRSSSASVKIDYIFDYLSERFVDFAFFSGNVPDQALASRINAFLEKDDLVIRDLGYYALDRIKEIEQKQAFYTSRLKSDVVVYEYMEDSVPLDLAKFLDKIGQGVIDVKIFIGKEKHPVRLVACLMDEASVNKRRREANKTAKRQGTTISYKKSSLLKYAIFITNVPAKVLPSTSVMAIYRARWRIELIFKQWKSCLKLHIFKGYNKERFHCFLYGRLIMIILLGILHPALMQYAQELGRELSCFKMTNYLILDHALPRALEECKTNELKERLLKDIPRRLCMDKRKRLSLRSNVRAGNSYYTALKDKDLSQYAA